MRGRHHSIMHIYKFIYLQLFRRVAAALPGMDSTENKPPEDSILLLNIYLNIILTCFSYIHDQTHIHMMSYMMIIASQAQNTLSSSPENELV